MLRRLITAVTAGLMLPFFAGVPVTNAATTVVVTPASTQGWSTGETTAGGSVSFINDASAPAGVGALQLTTNDTVAAKAQYVHAAPANTLLSALTDLSYSTKQNSASFAQGDSSYQLAVWLKGTSGFTTLVFEPYQNNTVTPDAWQSWDVDAGKFWSTQTVSCSEGNTVTAGSGGAPFYSLAELKTLCPSAVVLGYGVNIGSNNPSYNVEADQFNFNGTIYNFEPTVGPPQTLSDCSNWQAFNDPSFTSGSKCLQYVAQHIHQVTGSVHYTAYGLKRRADFGMNTAINYGLFYYSDNDGNWYGVKISAIKVSGDSAWFAGQVFTGSNPAWTGNWLFAKVTDNSPDKIWGSFTDQTTALNGVSNMTSPADGPFNVTSGNLMVH